MSNKCANTSELKEDMG